MPRQRILWAMIGLTLAGAIGAATLAGFRLHHAVLLERQTLRTQELSQAASATSRPSRRPTSRSSSAARTGSSTSSATCCSSRRPSAARSHSTCGRSTSSCWRRTPPSRHARGATARAIPGTGLGLSIAKAIVDAHGGRIEVRDGPARGTTFRVSLPSA